MNDEIDDLPPSPPGEKAGQILTLLGSISEQLDGQGDALNFIARCVAPREDADGSKLEDLLAGLIGRLDRQSAILRTISDGLTKIGKTLPLDIVRAIDDNLGNAGTPANGSVASGKKGHGQETRP